MKVCFLLALSLLVGCASGRVQVLSSPDEAEVFVGRDGKAPEKIGVTPPENGGRRDFRRSKRIRSARSA